MIESRDVRRRGWPTLRNVTHRAARLLSGVRPDVLLSYCAEGINRRLMGHCARFST